MNKSMLLWQDLLTAFSIFMKNSGNMIPKYDRIIVPHLSSISSFTRFV